jgi:pyridoxamine 5'-phosphate oxidase
MADLSALLAHVAVPTSGYTLPTPLPVKPFELFKQWFSEETAANRTPNPNAMSLATIDPDGTPSCRIVLCRGINVDKGYVILYTNYQGRKGRALLANPRAAISMHFDHSDRQVRIEGFVVQSPAAESDAYFQSRRWESRLAAWMSNQSQPIQSREELLGRAGSVMEKLKLNPAELLERGNDVFIPRPPHWGGFRLYAKAIELWLGGPGRLHDRAVWRREIPLCGSWEQADAAAAADWSGSRLQP